MIPTQTEIAQLHRVALKLTRDHDQADDLVQDTVIRAHRYTHRYDSAKPRSVWMRVILRNVFRNRYKADACRHRTLGRFRTQAALARMRDDPETLLGRMEDIAAVRAGLDTLPANFRRAVSMHELSGHTCKEIAAEMGCPEGTVMSRIKRGRDGLARALR
jgi:RNA polymerase sigma-70 factor, ECF subfamily